MRFKDKKLEMFWLNPVDYPLKRFSPELLKQLYRRLQMLDAAKFIEDLRVPPGNRLEALRGDRKGQFNIRVNQQWRICFSWVNGEAQGVEICDYHK